MTTETKKDDAVYVVLDPDIDDVRLKLLSVKFTGVPNPIVNKCTGNISFVRSSFFTAVVSVLAIIFYTLSNNLYITIHYVVSIF